MKNNYQKSNPNETYSDTVKKYTINISHELYNKIQEKSRSLGIYRSSIYIRAILEREVNKTEPLSLDEIVEGRKESLKVASADHRRERLQELYSQQKPSWIKLKIRKVYDLFNPKQQTFDFKK